MSVDTQDERFAILLKSLGKEFSRNVLQHVSPALATSLKTSIERMSLAPPSDEVTTEVLEEFNRFMEFALANSQDLLDSISEQAEEGEENLQFVSSGDPYADLNALHDYQLAGALRHETGSTIALVLNQISPQRVGAVLAQLPDSIRQDAFLRLQNVPTIPAPLLRNIVTSIVERASVLDASAASDPDHLADERTAELLRAMDRKTRTEMMAALEKDRPEVAERVKDLMFVFEDVLRFTDKTVQKLLGSVQTSELATVLKNASDDIIAKITSNLSKRAKASLMEEIEYLDAVSSEEETMAQKAVCGAYAKLDEAGDLEMVE